METLDLYRHTAFFRHNEVVQKHYETKLDDLFISDRWFILDRNLLLSPEYKFSLYLGFCGHKTISHLRPVEGLCYLWLAVTHNYSLLLHSCLPVLSHEFLSKRETAYSLETLRVDYRVGIDCRPSIKCRLHTRYKIQTDKVSNAWLNECHTIAFCHFSQTSALLWDIPWSFLWPSHKK